MGSKFLFAAAALLAATPATAAVTVIGNSSARTCFEAAESRSAPSLSVLRVCDEALTEHATSHYDTVATYVNRGILKARLGNLHDAIADYDEALSRDPDQPEAYLNKGFAMLHLPEVERQATPMFDTALAKKTRRPEFAYYGRGIANELNGNVRAAYYDYRQASRLSPKWRDPQLELARFKVE